MISSSQRPLPDNTQHSQQTNVHAPGGIRTHNPSRRAAADLPLAHGLLHIKNSAKQIAMTDESTRNFSFFADLTATLILPYQTEYIM